MPTNVTEADAGSAGAHDTNAARDNRLVVAISSRALFDLRIKQTGCGSHFLEASGEIGISMADDLHGHSLKKNPRQVKTRHIRFG